MITATVAGVTETYAYDGDGVRFSRQVGTGPVTRYVSDVNTGLPVTIDDGSRRYVWGIGLAYAVSGTTLEVYHTDRLGSVRAVTDAAGAVTATWRTDEFGIPTSATGTSTQPYGFTGEPRDASGLSYLRARYYDPTLGRFTTRDTWPGTTAQPATLHRYAYVANNPATATDPSGRCLPAAAAGAAAGSVVPIAGTAGGATAGFILCLGFVAGGIVVGLVIGEAVVDQQQGQVIPKPQAPLIQVPANPEGPPRNEDGGDPIFPKGWWKAISIALGIAIPVSALLGQDEFGNPLPSPKPRVLTPHATHPT